MVSQSPRDSFAGHRERRASPRVLVPSLQADVRQTGNPVPVHDLSLGGFAIASQAGLEPGSLHYCDLIAPDGPPVKLLAQVIRAERMPGTSHYLIRFRFAMLEPNRLERVQALLDSVATSLGFDRPSHPAPDTRH